MEMLVVVILVGIIMSVAGLRVSGMMTQQKVIRAASTIQTQMETAFALAVCFECVGDHASHDEP
jgi:type II secretory pathway pseudopilin PulG